MTVRQEADGVLLLDKPPGFSSTQALSRAKRALQARKAGHTGTLDPFATGLLPLVFGEATKFGRFLIDAVKAYRATLRLGARSSTGDPEGEVTFCGSFGGDDVTIDEVLRSFRGRREQVPPMHSAVRIGGRRLYDLAREGTVVERASRPIDILELARVSREGDELVIDVTCSKGTYVRTLAMEIGEALGCGAYLTALRRTRVGPFGVDGAIPLDDLMRLEPAEARSRLMAPSVLVASLPHRELPPGEARRFTQGQVLLAPDVEAGAEVAIFGPGGAFLGVAWAEVAGRLEPLRLVATGTRQAP